MRRNWVLRSANPASIDELTRALSVPPLLARLLVGRGWDTPDKAREFLCADLDSLADPARMAGLPEAVALIRQALDRGDRIGIVGDYDADGVTGTALLFWVLRSMGAPVEVQIPHRTLDGYGLRVEGVRRAHKAGVRLLITVDCGTTSFEEIALARSLGIETIVVDHHDLAEGRLPDASALLNPLRSDCGYPEKELASVGVAFTLARGLLNKSTGYKVPGTLVFEHLDLVALGTVADMAPLTGENRVLVKAGLHALAGTAKPGLKALLDRTELSGKALQTEDVSFSLAPPLNAAGRMDSAEESFRLLTCTDPEEAVQSAAGICRKNQQRRTSEREAFQKALQKVSREINFSQDRVIVLEDEKWHPGVIGILATRLTYRFHRPTIVIAVGGDSCRGSARSIRSFHLIEALHAVREHLVEFGGHPGAAGLTIERSRIGLFREAINRVAKERLDPNALAPTVDLDGELPLSALTQEMIRGLEALAPFGLGNPHPVFSSTDGSLMGMKGAFSTRGIRLKVGDPQGRLFEALQPRELLWDSWNLRRVRGNVHLAYSPVRFGEEDGPGIELRLRDLKLA